VKSGNGEVEKQSVEHWTRDQLELIDEEQRQTNEHVRHDAGYARLSHAHDPATIQVGKAKGKWTYIAFFL